MFVREPAWAEDAEALLTEAVGPRSSLPRYGGSRATRLVGWTHGDALVAAAGLTIGDWTVTIGHVATRSDLRRRGLGAALVHAIAADIAPLPLLAATDDDAVGFYRRLGFTVTEIESPWPARRYRCVLG